jgi:hypothetical protein
MKLERLQEYVLPVVATLCGMGFAVLVGYLMGQGQHGKVLMLLGVLFLGFLTMVMRQYIWLLLVFTWPWAGTVPVVPGGLSVRDIGIAAGFVAFLALGALKVVRRKPRYEVVDLLMIALLVYMVTVLIRNPVGFLITQSDRVGGRPYFNIGMACAAYYVLTRASIPFASGSKVVIFSTLASSYQLRSRPPESHRRSLRVRSRHHSELLHRHLRGSRNGRGPCDHPDARRSRRALRLRG